MNELIGHDIEFNNLSINLNKSNLHNSIIIHGPKGIGKRTFIDGSVYLRFCKLEKIR